MKLIDLILYEMHKATEQSGRNPTVMYMGDTTIERLAEKLGFPNPVRTVGVYTGLYHVMTPFRFSYKTLTGPVQLYGVDIKLCLYMPEGFMVLSDGVLVPSNTTHGLLHIVDLRDALGFEPESKEDTSWIELAER